MRTVIRYPNLKDKGVVGSRMSLHRLRKSDPSFPLPIEIGGGVGWFEDEIDDWLASRPRLEHGACHATKVSALKSSRDSRDLPINDT